MRELKVSNTLTGWFDVKVYNERVPRENRKLKGEDENIAFTVTFAAGDTSAMPFAEHGKPYTDGRGNPRLRVNFKIGTRCTWFDEMAQPIAKPLNSQLDGKQYECVIQYSTRDGDPTNPLSPKGYWVDAIQLREVQRNPFTAMPGAAPMPPQPAAVPQQQQYQQQPQQPQYQPQRGQQFPPMFDENGDDNFPLPY